MKWIFALLFLFSFSSYAVQSVPAKANPGDFTGSCTVRISGSIAASKDPSTMTECIQLTIEVNAINNPACPITPRGSIFTEGPYKVQAFTRCNNKPSVYYAYLGNYSAITSYSCPPDGNPTFTVGPVDLNGSKVCQTVPKVCMMGAVVRVASDGKETCVSNCTSAAGMAYQSQYFYQAGPTAGSTAGEIKCYGQCSIETVGGGGIQLSNGAWTGNFTFTGANCPVVRPEPTVDSESNTGGNGDAPTVDESTTSEGTNNALGELSGAASSATGSQVQPSATGPDGTSTLNDVAQTVADAANAQIQATSSQNVATGNLIANTTKDLQNTIIRTGSAGASSVLQAQGNSKLDGIGTAIGEGNGKLDGIKSTLDEISDKLEEPGEETPFVPGAGSGAFWESILPESSFTEIKDKKAQSIQDMKDLSAEFQTSILTTDLSASGNPDEWVLNMHGTAMPFGMGAFQMILDMGLAAVVLLLCALYSVYIVANRK
ncbi:hypothetical protein [Aeromonas caviae]|uniref:hypothetical protein n=1 Tax=Aeromonas caviae TaxID=648 RepID=UPI0015DF094F|nr:hypothetical protein [Aeromonas caviae]QLL84687.1 hypothetical protein GWG05_10400 [Aeromonas caviae]